MRSILANNFVFPLTIKLDHLNRTVMNNFVFFFYFKSNDTLAKSSEGADGKLKPRNKMNEATPSKVILLHITVRFRWFELLFAEAWACKIDILWTLKNRCFWQGIFYWCGGLWPCLIDWYFLSASLCVQRLFNVGLFLIQFGITTLLVL